MITEARFADTATTPGDPLHVVIDSFDGGVHKFGPVAWQPRLGVEGAEYPQAGDTAYVEESDEGTWCVLLWTHP